MALNFFLLFLVMIFAGVLGGAVNYLVTAPQEADDASDAANKRPGAWWRDALFVKSIVMGIAASLVVPVFLQIAAIGVQENLLTNFLEKAQAPPGNDLASAYASLAAIAGFCVLAAFSSRSFLQSLSSKLMQDLQTETRQMKSNQKGLEEKTKGDRLEFDKRLESLVSELGGSTVSLDEPTGDEDEMAEESGDEPVGSATQASAFREEREGVELSDLDRQILKALAAKPNTRRSIKGIRTDKNMSQDVDYRTVKDRLYRLHHWGYVQKLSATQGGKLPRWKLASKGWVAID